MKKLVLSLSIIAAHSAWAQTPSTVTMFGIVDAAVQYTKADGAALGSGTKLALSTGGHNTSRFGVRGTEDLGGGLKANFWLESSLNNDDSTGFNLNISRRSFVGLSGGFGEVRLGREYTPYFVNHALFDVFGVSGVGGAHQLTGVSLMPTTPIRANNSIFYVTPSSLPVFVEGMYVFGEQTSAANANKNQGNAIGFRVGGRFGPAEVAAAYGQENGAGSAKYTDANIGAKVTFGRVVVMGMIDSSKDNAASAAKRNNMNLGVQMGVGAAGTVRASFVTSKQKLGGAVTANAQMLAAGYVHDLSKRTALYGTVSVLDNKDSFMNRSIAGRTVSSAGGKTSALEFGLRHAF